MWNSVCMLAIRDFPSTHTAHIRPYHNHWRKNIWNLSPKVTYTHKYTHLFQCMYLWTQTLLQILSKYFSERQTNPTHIFYPPTPLFFHSGVSFHGHICQPVTFNLSLLLFLIMASHCVLSPSLDTQWWKDIFSHVAKMSLGKTSWSCLKRNLLWYKAEDSQNIYILVNYLTYVNHVLVILFLVCHHLCYSKSVICLVFVLFMFYFILFGVRGHMGSIFKGI